MFAIILNRFFISLQNVEVEEERVDDRSVDDLLSFINGDDGGMCLNACYLHYWKWLP